MRIGKTKRRAAVVLFLSGWTVEAVARLFRIGKRDVELLVRAAMRGQ